MPGEDNKTPSEESRPSGERRRRRRRPRSPDNRSQGRPRSNPPQSGAKTAATSEDSRPAARSRNSAQEETKKIQKPADNRAVGRSRGQTPPGEAQRASRAPESRQDNRSPARSRNPVQEDTKKATKPTDNRAAARVRGTAQQVETKRPSRSQTNRGANPEQPRLRATGPSPEPRKPAAPEPKVEDWREPDSLSRRAALADEQAPADPDDLDDLFEEKREPAGANFFRSFENYDQQQALECLTDLNIKLLEEAKPVAGEWTYLALVEERCPDEEIEHLKRAFPVPPGVYAVLVDSGLSLRAIMTATPMYERMFEFNFIAEASFDCWIQGEWMREEVFEGKEKLLKHAPQLLKEYLEKDIASHQEIVQAPHIAGAVPPARTEW